MYHIFILVMIVVAVVLLCLPIFLPIVVKPLTLQVSNLVFICPLKALFRVRPLSTLTV